MTKIKPQRRNAMSKKKRALYIEILKHNVNWLAEHEHFSELELICDLTGYCNNYSSTTCHDLGTAIVALAAVIPDQRLRNTIGEAVLQRELKRRGGHTRAHALSDRAIRSPELAAVH